MCERHLILPAVLLALGTAPAGAQQDLASLQAQRTALIARADSLRDVVARLRVAERDSGVVADVRSGALHIRTTQGLAALATDGLKRAQQTAAASLGPDVEAIARRVAFTLNENHSNVTYTGGLLGIVPSGMRRTKDRMTSAALSATLDGKELSGVTLYPPVTADDISESVLMVLERAAAFALPANLATWSGSRIPLREPRPELWPDIYRAKATADAAVVRRCVAGERAACRVAFALDSLPANRLAAWYDDSDLPGLARSAGDHLQRSSMTFAVSGDERDECVDRHNLDLCRRILGYLPADAFPIPLQFSDRATLVGIALRVGGAQALTRLNSATGTIAEQLSAAAGVPADSLVALWQQRVMAARPSSPLPSVVFVLASLTCIAACAVLAARGQPWK